jgi:hypothetical protein
MDHDTPDILCSEFSVPFLRLRADRDQVALFLLCMPIIAAPLEALAVLGACNLVKIPFVLFLLN